jgi:isoprenylcysteine carboxyl methyltransferase (ICMT) family protein YpbQ
LRYQFSTMTDLLTASPFILIILAWAAFAFAVVMQPIFVWIICSRLKRTNQLLAKLEKNTVKPLMPTRR